jgi:phosphatidylglycerophosphatase C
MTDTHPRPVVAAFDVDGTLTTRDCVRPFLQRVGGTRSIVTSILRAPRSSISAAVRRDRDRMKDVVVGGVFGHRPVAAVERAGEHFADQFVRNVVRPDTLARLRWHQGEGHRTVLVSASLRPYLEPFGRWLGVDGVVCTDAAVDRSGAEPVYLSHLDGGNCRAAQKVSRLRTWLDAHGLADAELWAYGDSAGDRQLLDAADHPVWVKRVVIGASP